MSKRIPGPSRWETLRRLFPVPFTRFPAFLTDNVARYGNVLQFDLPWRSYVFVNEPALIKDILVTQQHAFSKSLGTHVLRMLLGEGLLTSEDPLHRTMRRIVQPAFHRDRVAGYVRVMERDAAEFADGVVAGEPFDVHAAMTALTLRIATETLFGSDESDSAAAVSNALHLMMEEFPHMLVPLGKIRQWLPLRSTRRFYESREMLDRIIYGLIARRRADGIDRGDALSMLLAAYDAEGSAVGSQTRSADEQIRDEVMTLFMAGHETTANALTWTFYLLAQHPEIDERVARAAQSGDRAYIMRVLKESLRLYPPAWIVGRETLRDVTLADGTFVPAKMTVFIAPLVLHRRADHFPNPDAFDPDRWLGEEPQPFAYVPFGGGARRCIGEEFAWGEAAVVLTEVTKRYRFERVSGEPIGLAPLVTLRPAGPVPMRARPRTLDFSNSTREVAGTTG
jgi:cytochrome P450